MKIEEIRAALNEPGFSVMDCCRSTGLHINSVYKIRKGKTSNPNPLTKQAIEKYLEKQSLAATEG